MPEQQLVWMTQNSNWWFREVVFTNRVSGNATIYVHMGYGNVHGTGEFTDIRLERLP